jgi:3-isopropylmalate/(R)-2-methylmalate dehydratase small subunit
VIAPSFTEIFRANCYRNGMLPVALPASEVDALMHFVAETPGAALTVDLVSRTVAIPDGRTFPFRIEPDRRDALLLGLDEVGASLTRTPAIERFERAHWDRRPWLRRRSGGKDPA